MSNILVESIDKEIIVIGFINSSGETEYTKYKAVDGGCIGDPDCAIGSVLAAETNIIEYQDYELKEIKD